MHLPFTTAPESICLLRLSAVGDVCHALAIVRTIQKHWPQTKITWIIGKTEHSLLKGIDNIEFIVFDKHQGLAAYRSIRKTLRGREFSALLHMQMSLRASLISVLVKSPVKLGFDRKRAHDLQWLFSNHKIPCIDKQHVLESFFTFIHTLGLKQTDLEWNIPVTDEDKHKALTLVGNHTPYVVISPCSSHAYRNWTRQGYADVAKYLIERHNKCVVVTGGASDIERNYGEYICRATKKDKVIDLVGKTSLPQLLAILKNADCVVAPDSGPAHMATAVNTPVVGLYATTNPDRARAYLSKALVINKYPEAVQEKYHKAVNAVPWGTRVRDDGTSEGTMARIQASDVNLKIDAFYNNAYSK